MILGIVNGFNVSLYSYLIGSLLALNNVDIILSVSLLIAAIIFYLFFYKDMLFIIFNEELAQLSRKKVKIANILFTILIAMVVVISIRAVGILLVSALLVIPTLLSLNLSSSFKQTIFISSLCAFVAVVAGIIVSFLVDIPPSGAIVMLLFFGFLVTTFFRRTS